MQPMLNPDRNLFDPLGRGNNAYMALSAALPDQLQLKLQDARFGIYNAEPIEDVPITPEDEILRQLQAGQAVAVNEKGEIAEVPKWTPPVKVAGESAFYAIMVTFGGEQRVLLPVDVIRYNVGVWAPSDLEIAFLCMQIK